MRRRGRKEWSKEPYHDIVDRLAVGDVVLWGRLRRPRTIRTVIRYPTDHVNFVRFVKLNRSAYPSSTTIYARHDLIRNVHGIVAENVDLCKVDVECQLTAAISEHDAELQHFYDTGDWNRWAAWNRKHGLWGSYGGNPLDPGQNKTVGTIY